MQITERKLRQIIRGVIIEEQINKRNRLLEEGYVLEEGKIGRMATGAVLAGLAFLAANGHITGKGLKSITDDITGKNNNNSAITRVENWEKEISQEMDDIIDGKRKGNFGNDEYGKFMQNAVEYLQIRKAAKEEGRNFVDGASVVKLGEKWK